MTNVTYTPAEGENHTVKTHGVVFKANVPVPVDDKRLTEQMISELITTAEGIPRRVSKTVKIPLVKVLAGNPQFRVEGTEQAKRVAPMRRPETADEYMTHAADWIRACETADAMDAAWDAEQEMRDECGLSQGQLESLSVQFETRRAVVNRMNRRAAAPPVAQQQNGQRSAAR